MRTLKSTLLAAGTLVCALLPLATPALAETPMQAYVNAMQPGWNYGNTYDAGPNETSWGNSVLTQAIVDGVVAKGYKSVRLPVTWTSHIGAAPDYTIDPAWMTKVKNAVDLLVAADLYVMINIHHDAGWLYQLPQDHDAVLDKYQKVWAQIADVFKDYPDKLMFESINEPGFKDANDNNLPDAEMRTYLHEINTAFVQLIRASGGSNDTRPLVLPTVYTRGDQPMLDSLKATIDSLNDPNLIATIHFYGWWPFSENVAGSTKFDADSVNNIHVTFDSAYDTFTAHGIPVVIGEWGLLSNHSEHGESLKYHEYAAHYMGSKKITHMLWDTGGMIDRNTLQWRDQELGAIMTQAWTGRALTAERDLLFIRNDVPARDTAFRLNLNGNGLVSIQDGSSLLVPGVDYTVSGEVVTFKASFLSKYATGAFGSKTNLYFNSTSGPAWRVDVRYVATPVQATIATETGAAISIPTAFNGDVLATMESKYDDGSIAGPTNWTAFQMWASAYSPNYGGNAIKLDKDFFKGAPGGVVNFAFYFWSGKVVTYQMAVVERSSAPGTELNIYGDALATGWTGAGAWGGWGANENLAATAEVHSGSRSISASPVGWGGLVLSNYAAPSTAIYNTLVFWIHGGPTGGQNIGVGVVPNGDWGISTNWVSVKPVANTWQKIEIPLNTLGVAGRADINHIQFSDWSGSGAATFYLDDVMLTTAKSLTAMDVYGAPTPNVAAPLGVTKQGFSLNRRTNRMVQQVKIQNPGATPITGPVYLVLDSLSANTTLANAAGKTSTFVPSNSPYVLVSSGNLAAGSTVTVTLEFTVPTSGGITYDARILSDGTTP
ncbi:MAG TPA: cellulase family glycosylhydrolase [Opitutaceae bacterium]|nr:cellulase family glycosylhydrolase [Opitutaceae bacterium]